MRYLILTLIAMTLMCCAQTIDPFEGTEPKFHEGQYEIMEDSTRLHLVVYDFIANVSAVKVDQWMISQADENFFYIQTQDGYYLQEVANNEVIVSDYNYSYDQMWGLFKKDNGTYCIHNRETRNYIVYALNTYIVYTAPAAYAEPTKFDLIAK